MFPLEDITLAIDSVFDDRYLILEVVGAGGMGRVYKARDIELDRIVAVKVLNTSLVGDLDDRSRFKSEGRILARLNHDNIVKFYTYGIFQDRIPYMVMAYVSGTSLREYFKRSPRLPADLVLKFAVEICDGLKAAHDLGIVHRDIKPANVLLIVDSDGVESVKLVDFGLSRVLSSSPVNITRHLTQTGMLIGSVHYMSPEQCKGQKADTRSDIYSLGCLIYEMLCGQQPFSAENPLALLSKHVSEAPRSLDEFTKQISLPAGFLSVVAKAMLKNPDERYQTIESLKSDLLLVQSGKGKLIPHVEAVSDGRKSARPGRVKTKSAVASFVAVLGITVVSVSCIAMYIMNASKKVSTTDAALTPINNVPRTVSGIAFYVEVDEQDPTKLTALHVCPTAETGDPLEPLDFETDKIEKLRAKCNLTVPVRPGQEVICKLNNQGEIAKVSGGAMNLSCSSAIRTVNQFLNSIVREQWRKAEGYISNSPGISLFLNKRDWEKHKFKPVGCNPKFLDAYGGHYPQVYRFVKVGPDSASVFVNERKLFVNQNRVAMFFMYGENFKITRIEIGEELDESR